MLVRYSFRRTLPILLSVLAGIGVLSACEPGSPPTDGTYVDPKALLPGAGALPPGGDTWKVPTSNVLYVSTTGSDSAAGTAAAPLKSIQVAADRSTDGTTIVLMGGVYSQTARIWKSRVTIQPYPGAAVWLDGSVKLSAWVQDGVTWRADNFTTNLSVPTGLPPEVVDPLYPLAADPHMVFINGVPLKQVATKAGVTAGKFYVDRAASKLYIGNDPASGEVRATTMRDALIVETNGSIVRGIGVRRYGTLLSDQGAVRAMGTGIAMQGMTFRQNAIAGLSIMAADAHVINTTSYENGRLGIHVDHANRTRIEDSEVYTNNVEQFAHGGAAGGIKMTYSEDAVVIGNAVHNNFGKGIWFDLSSHRSTTVRSVSTNNDVGIMVEMSTGGLVASNVASDNEDGIRILETSSAEIWNNTLWNNERGISFTDGLRGPVPVNATIRNNALCGSTDSTKPQVVVDDANGGRSAAAMGVTTNYNALYRKSTATMPYMFTWANYPLGKLVLKNIAEVKAQTGQEQQSTANDTAATCPFFAEYQDDPLVVTGAALPTNVAAAVGWTAGPVRVGLLELG